MKFVLILLFFQVKKLQTTMLASKENFTKMSAQLIDLKQREQLAYEEADKCKVCICDVHIFECIFSYLDIN